MAICTFPILLFLCLGGSSVDGESREPSESKRRIIILSLQWEFIMLPQKIDLAVKELVFGKKTSADLSRIDGISCLLPC